MPNEGGSEPIDQPVRVDHPSRMKDGIRFLSGRGMSPGEAEIRAAAMIKFQEIIPKLMGPENPTQI
ncbi:MAG: hypothetical protein AAB373_01160 [Patescibacteria group bacterium]